MNFNTFGASGHATGQTQGGHGRLRARVHHAHHIHAGERVHDHAGKLDLGGTGKAAVAEVPFPAASTTALVTSGWECPSSIGPSRFPRNRSISWPSTVVTCSLAGSDEQRIGPTPRQARTGLLTLCRGSFTGFLKQFFRTSRLHNLRACWVERQAPLSSASKRGRRPCRANRFRTIRHGRFFNSSRLSSTAYSSSAVSRRNSSIT